MSLLILIAQIIFAIGLSLAGAFVLTILIDAIVSCIEIFLDIIKH